MGGREKKQYGGINNTKGVYKSHRKKYYFVVYMFLYITIYVCMYFNEIMSFDLIMLPKRIIEYLTKLKCHSRETSKLPPKFRLLSLSLLVCHNLKKKFYS